MFGRCSQENPWSGCSAWRCGSAFIAFQGRARISRSGATILRRLGNHQTPGIAGGNLDGLLRAGRPASLSAYWYLPGGNSSIATSAIAVRRRQARS